MAAQEVKRVKLGSEGLEVSAQGLGCMSMSQGYGSAKPENDMIKLIRYAIHSGITFLDTADIYSPHANEILIGKLGSERWMERKSAASYKVWDHIKGVENTTSGVKIEICGEPSYIRACCEASLKRLGVDYIDLYYSHRVDTKIPIEVTMYELKKLVEEGKIKYIGLSEVCASTIRRAHAVHPISAVQIEWSLWCRDVEEEIIPTSRDLGIGVVSYSPLGRGFFSLGPKVLNNLQEGDYRMNLPRFKYENMELNKHIFEKVNEIATNKGCTTSQLALAWVHHRGDDVIPIPGTTKIENIDQNIGALSVSLTLENMEELESIPSTVIGDRLASSGISWRHSMTPLLTLRNTE